MNTGLGPLVPKNHFASVSFFREDPLVRWDFTESVLLTAYDIYRTSDFWVDSVISSGKTLKEALVECGFPQKTKLMADTGIFELEAKKAGISRKICIEVDIKLKLSDILSAYELTGADYYVSPDEIILSSDKAEVKLRKSRQIKADLLQVLEQISAKQVIGVIQIADLDIANDLYDFYRSNGVKIFASGGMIPYYRFNRDKFEARLRRIRELTKGFWLHAFGLPEIRLLRYYLHEIHFDSVDTSMLLYLAIKRKYLVKSKQIPVRKADFKKCGCRGCKNLTPEMYTRSSEFFLGLYLHNVLEARKIANEKTVTKEKIHEDVLTKESQEVKKDFMIAKRNWETAYHLLTQEKEKSCIDSE